VEEVEELHQLVRDMDGLVTFDGVGEANGEGVRERALVLRMGTRRCIRGAPLALACTLEQVVNNPIGDQFGERFRSNVSQGQLYETLVALRDGRLQRRVADEGLYDL